MIKQEAKSIDEATFSNKIEISADIAAKIKQLRKIGFLKAALYAGAIGIAGIIACFGIGYQNNAHAGGKPDSIVSMRSLKDGSTFRGTDIGGRLSDTNGNPVNRLDVTVKYVAPLNPQGTTNLATQEEEENEDDTPPQNQGNNPPQNNAQTYSIDQLKKEIAKNPNNAKLYILLANEQIKNKLPPQERIKTFLEARIYKNKFSSSDNILIALGLAESYYYINDFKKSREMYKEILVYDANHKTAQIMVKAVEGK
jgi:tetratricopeptide (TPR) repeat protein